MRISLKAVVALALGALLAAAASVSHAHPDKGVTASIGGQDAVPEHTWVLIDQDFHEGRITLSQSVMYGIYSMLAPELLPQRYRVEEPDVLLCGTPVILRGVQNYHRLSDDGRGTVDILVHRPSNQTHMDTENFRVHFDTSGAEMIQGWPDSSYLNLVAEACEHVRDTYHDTLGLFYPPSDGTAGGGQDLIDVYLKDLTGGVLGYAVPELGVPSTPWDDRSGYFSVDRNLGGDDLAKGVVAHEFFHIAQFGYDIGECGAFVEGGANWGTDIAYEEINTWVGSVQSFQAEPWRSLSYDASPYIYGACLWYFYLEERFSPQLVTRMYEEVRDYSAPYINEPDYIDALRNLMLSDYGITLEEAFAEWVVWRYLVWNNDDGEHFSDADITPWVVIPDKYEPGDFPLYSVLPSQIPEPLGTAFIRLKCDTGVPGGLLMDYDGVDEVGWASTVITVSDSGTEYSHWWTLLGPDGEGSEDVCDWDGYKRVVLVLSNLGTESFDPDTSSLLGSDVEFSVVHDPGDTCSLTGVPDLAAGQCLDSVSRMLSVSPNPVGPATTIGFAISETSNDPFKLAVYDVRGRLVTVLASGQQVTGIYSATWKGMDAARQRVASGVYFAVLTTSSGTHTHKLVVAR